MTPIDWRLGTMGFSYTDWVGGFYPKSIKQGEWLSFYSRHFNAVELDTTFYAVPDAQRVRRWRDQTPADFRFTVKTPRAITHDASIDRGVGPMLQFLDAVRNFEQKLGVVLIQFPPSFSSAEFRALSTFLRQLPNDLRFAIELRNTTWFTPATTSMLRDYHIALVAADYVGEPRPISVTSDFLYIRWIGEHDRFSVLDHEQVDPTARLLWWKEQIDRCDASVGQIFGLFNNDYAGYALATCNRFKQMMNLPVIEAIDPAQGTLFG